MTPTIDADERLLEDCQGPVRVTVDSGEAEWLRDRARLVECRDRHSALADVVRAFIDASQEKGQPQ